MADGEEKKKSRYTYEDIVRSNEEVAQAIRELSAKLSGAPATPAESAPGPVVQNSGVSADEIREILAGISFGLTPEQAEALGRTSEISDKVSEISDKVDAIPVGATTEEVRRIVEDVDCGITVGQLQAAVSQIHAGMTPEQEALLRSAAANGDAVRAAIAEQEPVLRSVAATGDSVKNAVAEQETLLKSVASSNDAVREAFAEQNARIDELAVSSAPAGASPSDKDPYLTSREQFEIYSKIINRRDGEFAEKQFISILEKICELREDFRRLTAGIEQNVAGMSSTDVLNSYRTYQVDLENILRDAGVRFGSFGTQGQVADANLQRLVGFVDTDDPSKDGTVAKRLSSGYEYKGKAVYKERVMVYKTKKQ